MHEEVILVFWFSWICVFLNALMSGAFERTIFLNSFFSLYVFLTFLHLYRRHLNRPIYDIGSARRHRISQYNHLRVGVLAVRRLLAGIVVELFCHKDDLACVHLVFLWVLGVVHRSFHCDVVVCPHLVLVLAWDPV